ncbi:hypothetical protein [Actinophytocola xanthii]|uniref:hypothetical protein n=1 Tax=Actinophytocola xanthii TaxID=1912961 RepID=UPI0011775B94|nr:hypothetical protein [Actinophytocola xanthii]
MTDGRSPSLSPRDQWKELLRVTRDPFVERFAAVVSRNSPPAWDALQLPENYAEQQCRLHIPALSRQAITASPETATRMLTARLDKRFRRTDEVYRHLAAGGALPDLSLSRITRSEQPRLGSVPGEIGLWLQREVHYLHCERADTVVHVGAFAPNTDVPALCLSFSPCDREYLLDALTNATHGRRQLAPESVLVLTRSTATVELPMNLVSRLIAWSARELRRCWNSDVFITALNPLLGFDGASLRSAGFVPFALTPMTYQYDEQGLYSTRRVMTGTIGQMLETPPIVWLARSTSRCAQPLVHRMVTVLPNAYLRVKRT